MATSRTTLRRSIGDRLGDMLVLRATSDSSSADTFTDAVNLGDRGDDAPSLVNKIGYFIASGETLGEESRITNYASATRTLTLSPELSTTPATGDELELWNTTERVGSIQTIHRLLNDAIRAVAGFAVVETYDTAQTFNARSPYLEIPSDWVRFGGADYVDRSGYTHDVPPSKLRVRPGQRTVEIMGRPSWRSNNLSVQLWGYAPPAEMTADSGADGETSVDSEWLIESVLEWVAIAASARASDIRGPAEERRGSFFSQKAQLYRRNVGAAERGLGIPLP